MSKVRRRFSGPACRLARLGALLALALVFSTGMPAQAAVAPPGTAGLGNGPAGTDEQVRPTLTLVGQTDFGGAGFTGNVTVLDGVAYVGSYGTEDACPELGVRIVDLSDPANPNWVATTAIYPGTTAEHAVVVRVDTPSFRGTLLGVGIQRCSHEPAAEEDTSPVQTGLALIDVTDPARPVELGFYDNGPLFPGVHEFDFAIRGGQVLALTALERWDRDTAVGDFQVLDVTNPRTPQRLSDWGIWSGLGLDQGLGCYQTLYAHSVRYSPSTDRAYVSYWDAGLVIFDLSDPSSPRVEGVAIDRSFEGNTHSADEMAGGILLVAEEAGFSAQPVPLRVGIESAAGKTAIYGCELPQDDALPRDGSIAGPLVNLGPSCSLAPSPGAVAVYEERGATCGLVAAAKAASAAGAVTLLVVQAAARPFFEDATATPPPLFQDLPDSLGLPVVVVGLREGGQLGQLAREGTTRVVMPQSRPAGALRIWDITNPAFPILQSVYRPAESIQYPPPRDGGFTLHNPLAIGGQYALVSSYAAGIRLLDLSNPSRPVELASYVPPAVADPHDELPTAPIVWGVAKEGQIVLASDMNGGLYVLRLEGLLTD